GALEQLLHLLQLGRIVGIDRLHVAHVGIVDHVLVRADPLWIGIARDTGIGDRQAVMRTRDHVRRGDYFGARHDQRIRYPVPLIGLNLQRWTRAIDPVRRTVGDL